MRKRPLAVTIIGWLYVAVGCGGLAWHATEFRADPRDTVWIELTELTAAAAGIYVLRGRNWARWLAVAWMAAHVGIAALDSLRQMAVHAVFLAAIGYGLFRPGSARYFRPARAGIASVRTENARE